MRQRPCVLLALNSGWFSFWVRPDFALLCVCWLAAIIHIHTHTQTQKQPSILITIHPVWTATQHTTDHLNLNQLWASLTDWESNEIEFCCSQHSLTYVLRIYNLRFGFFFSTTFCLVCRSIRVTMPQFKLLLKSLHTHPHTCPLKYHEWNCVYACAERLPSVCTYRTRLCVFYILVNLQAE